MAEDSDREKTGGEEETEAGARKGTSDSDWLSQDAVEMSDAASLRLRRSRVRRGLLDDEDSGEDVESADVDVGDLDAFQEELGDLDGSFEDDDERDPTRGISLGESGKGWMEVEVDEDGKSAALKALDFGGDKSLNARHIEAALKDEYDVVFGLDDDLISELVKRAAAGESIEETHVIARAEPAQRGENGSIDCLFLKEADEGAEPAYLELQRAFQKKTLSEVVEHCPLACLVATGQRIAVEVPPADGVPGKDVYGNVLSEPGDPAKLTVGLNVDHREDGYYAEILGYACMQRDMLAVISPLWISTDRFEAYFVRFNLAGRHPELSSDAFIRLLEMSEVSHGIQEATIETLCRDGLGAEAQGYLLARGEPPRHGVDTHIAYGFDAEPKPGAVLPDGTIDLKQRNTVVTVQVDAPLGEIMPATDGQHGMTVKGERIEARDGERKKFSAGRNVRAEEAEGGNPRFYSEIEGSVRREGDELHVDKVLNVTGDVDYTTGNIETTADVIIEGSVKPGFKVKTAGSVVVGGVVESGGIVQAGRDVVVAGGILGEKTRIVAQGGLEAKFVQNGVVLVQGDVFIGSYVYNANLRSGGSIVVNFAGEKQRAGSIIGGQVVAAKGLEASRLGSASTDRTVIGIRGSPRAEQQLAQARKAVHQFDEVIVRILRSLGIPKVTMQLLRRCIARAPREKRPRLAELIKKLQEVVKKREEAASTQLEVAREIANDLQKSTVQVLLEVYPDVIIKIGNAIENVPEKMTRQTFFRGEEGISWRSL